MLSLPDNPIMRMIFVLKQPHPLPWISFRAGTAGLAWEALLALVSDKEKDTD